MAFHYSPKTIADGLELALDAGNPKSYPGSGTSVKDLTGTHPGGTLSGGTSFVDNNYFSFDGSNDSLQFSPNDVFERGTTSFTIEAWARLNAQGSNNLALVIGGGNPLCDVCDGGYMILFSGTNNLNLRFDDSGLGNMDSITYNNPSSFIDGSFHHIVGMRNGTNTLLYLDGTQVASGTDNQVNVNDISTFYVSGWSNYRGEMDVALSKIYNRALSADEVLQNYNAHKTRFGL